MRKILVAAASLGLLLVLALITELAFGTWFSQDPLDALGLARDSAVTVSPAALYSGAADFTYRRDHWGLRGAGTDPAQVTILTVGGTTTDQPTLPDEATWQAVMERELRAAGRPAVVANAGLDGQATAGHLRAMAEWFPQVPGLKPRFILFSVGAEEAGSGGADIERRPGRFDRIRRHSALWRWAAKFSGAADERREPPGHRRVDYDHAEWTDKPAEGRPQPPGSSPDAFRERLRQLAVAAHGMGAVPVFVTQARGDFKVVDGKVLGVVEPGGLNGIDQYRLLSAYNQATRQVCGDEGLLCLDLARELTFERGDFYDYLHNTPQGAEKIGRWLASKLAGLV
ncbi:MAG: GDSL-type esterase/lipase family protein [Magnetospirillum sp.]|nr:GDSL-type esterase/lipase family protein [Magnetospirillum sp.]